MFEECLTATWICPKCGKAKKVRVDEITKKSFERNRLGEFEYRGIIISTMRVYCFKCGSECYME